MSVLLIPAATAIAAKEFHVRPDVVRSRTRQPRVLRARHVAMWLARNRLNCLLPEIAEYFGFDHTSVAYGCKVIALRAAKDPELASALERLSLELDAVEVGETTHDVLFLDRQIAEMTAQKASILAKKQLVVKALQSDLREVEERRVTVKGLVSTASLIGSLDRYLRARAQQDADRFTRAESSSRRVADEAFRALSAAYARHSDNRRAAQGLVLPPIIDLEKEPAHGEG